MAIPNVHETNKVTSKYMKQKLIKLKGEIDKSTTVVEDLEENKDREYIKCSHFNKAVKIINIMKAEA